MRRQFTRFRSSFFLFARDAGEDEGEGVERLERLERLELRQCVAQFLPAVNPNPTFSRSSLE
jgi:hypothetical protein